MPWVLARKKRQAGSSVAGVLVVIFVIAVIGLAIWRFVPDLIPQSVREQLPRSPLDFSEASVSGAGNAASSQPTAAGAPTAAENPPLYKWQDASGVWNITDKPPAGRAYEKVVINPDTNIMPAEPTPDEETLTPE